MLSPQELKSRISSQMTMQLMEYLGAEVYQETNEYIIYTSICHGSDSKKLYYYPQTNSFYCWSQCGGNVDHISLVQQFEGLSFEKAIEWLENFFNIGKHTFGRPKIEYKERIIKPKEIDLNEKLPSYNESILNTFYNISPIEWLNENISPSVMKQFEIKIDINTNSIIIPCKDINNNLIGIRQRNLDKQTIEEYGKYMVYT